MADIADRGGRGRDERSNNDGTKIFVANLTYNTKARELEAMFSTYGKFKEVNLAEDKFTGRSKCFAFVTMEDPGDAQEAVRALNGKELDGRIMKVELATGRPSSRPPRDDDRGGYAGGFAGGDRERERNFGRDRDAGRDFGRDRERGGGAGRDRDALGRDRERDVGRDAGGRDRDREYGRDRDRDRGDPRDAGRGERGAVVGVRGGERGGVVDRTRDRDRDARDRSRDRF